MRLVVLTGARAVLLAGPAVLGFFSGGYFDEPRVWAGLGAWVLVVVATLTGEQQLPKASAPRLALLGLAGLAAWTLASFTWAPLAGTAYHDGQRVFLYLGALVAATALLRRGWAQRMVEPAVAAGAVVVILYGLSERLAPWLVSLHHSLTSLGRLEQPLTYWNAMGEVAAVGLVLSARVAGTPDRPHRLRVAAAAASAPLGLGLYLTFSRGALFAFAAGLIVLAVVNPSRRQLRSVMVVVATGILAALSGAFFPSVVSLFGTYRTRVVQGTLTLLLLLVIASIAGWVQLGVARREQQGALGVGKVKLPRGAALFATIVIGGSFVGFLALGVKEGSAPHLSTSAARFGTLQSNRYAYWRVALRAIRAEPLRGVGGGGWAVYWLRYRPIADGALDAHSLYIQTLAELGLVGFALLAIFLGGVALAARDAIRLVPALAVGPFVGFVVWAIHAALDWDWEMPAATLPAILLAGALLAAADRSFGARAVGSL